VISLKTKYYTSKSALGGIFPCLQHKGIINRTSTRYRYWRVQPPYLRPLASEPNGWTTLFVALSDLIRFRTQTSFIWGRWSDTSVCWLMDTVDFSLLETATTRKTALLPLAHDPPSSQLTQLSYLWRHSFRREEAPFGRTTCGTSPSWLRAGQGFNSRLNPFTAGQMKRLYCKAVSTPSTPPHNRSPTLMVSI